LPRVFFRLAPRRLLQAEDFLSQGALGKPLPTGAPHLRREWDGVSVFDSRAAAERVGRARNWRIGEYIVELDIPEDAPLAFVGPGRSGHWLIYNADGEMVTADEAIMFLDWIVSIVHGPTGQTS
jgi:hypothetical protein